MEFRNIETFVRAAELLSFSRTAEELGYSQAAITVQIRQLEEELDTKLFDRVGRHVALTAKGEGFLQYAEEILRASDDALAFGKKKGAPSGVLRVDVGSSISSKIMPSVVEEFYHQYPDVKLCVKTSDYAKSGLERLRHNEVDFLYLIEKKSWIADVVSIAECREDLVFVASKGSPFVGQENIPLEDLAYKKLISSNREISFCYYLEQLFIERNIEMKPAMEISAPDVIVKILLEGIGVSFLPLFMVEDEIADGSLVCLDVDVPHIEIFSQLMMLKSKWINPQMKAFINFMKDRR